MSKKNMKVKADPTKVATFTEKGDFERHMTNIKWGTGVQRNKKGKGSYTRKDKHKAQSFGKDVSFFFA